MPSPRDPSEGEYEYNSLPRIPSHSWRTACVNGEAQAEPHQRSERVIEDNELPFVHCDNMFVKDVAASDGLTMLSMYMKSFGYGMSHEVETKAADVRAVTWGVLNCPSCDPESSHRKRRGDIQRDCNERSSADDPIK